MASIPKRSRSLWAAPVAIHSIEQHARPKMSGNMDRVRAHRTRYSRRPVSMPGGVARAVMVCLPLPSEHVETLDGKRVIAVLDGGTGGGGQPRKVSPMSKKRASTLHVPLLAWSE